MATEKWVAGTTGLSSVWVTAINSSVINSIASSNAIAGDVIITNGTNLEIFCDVSITLASAAVAAPNFVGVYLYPLNSDNTTYGDGRFAAAALGPPPANYCAGNIGLVAATQAQEGTLTGVVMPPGSFKFVLWNSAGIIWAGSTTNTCKYRTYNRSIA